MSEHKKNYRFNTLAVHAGHEPDPVTLSRGVSVHRTASYTFKNTEHAANLFALKELGNIYTRLMNPTHDVLEQRVAALEGGAAALAVASGTSAIFYSIVNICENGDEVVSANNLYGGTFTQFNDILPKFGIRTRFVSPGDPKNFEAAINEKTRVIFVESIGNPSLDVTDLEAVSAIAKKHGLPLVVDATFATPYLQRPLEKGADIVVHSLTKWMGGHGAGLGGIVVDSGKFDWSSEKFSLYHEPDTSYHGLRWGHDLGELQSLAFILRMRTGPLRNLGAAISPDNAWILIQGIETLPLRMQRHCDNAMRVAQFLQNHSAVDWVRYPGLEQDPSHGVAKRMLENGYGSVVVFGISGGPSRASSFIEKLQLFSHLANVGDARSLALHPASTTHSQLSQEEQIAGGVLPEMIRLSIGIEDEKDILEDLDQALK